MWRRDDPQGNESGKIKWEIVKYTRGRGLDLGCGYQKTFPHFIGVDNGKDQLLFGNQCHADVYCKTAAELPMFASGSMDFVFASHLLEHFPLTFDDPRQWSNPIATAMAEKMGVERHTASEALREWSRVLRKDGYLILYVPDEEQYPKVGESGANPDHCFNCSYEQIMKLMRTTGSGWDLIEYQQRGGPDDSEYSLYFVFKKGGNGPIRESWSTTPKQHKSVGVVRYGAFGDLMQCASVLAGLKQQGYHVTLYTSPPGHECILHDPNIDEFYLQDKDQVPNHLLGEFWTYHSRKYHKWVNLSESVEASLLAMPGKSPHWWAPAARHRYMNHNYLEMSHLLAGVPHVPQVRFYPTDEERAWAKKEIASFRGRPVVLWALAGSSIHKTWGGLDRTIASILLEFPGSVVVLTGDIGSRVLEAGWQNEPRVKRTCGYYSIRQSMALLQEVDVVIGPETGMLNAACCMMLPKVVFLSHSTHENLTRDWVNVYALASKKTVCPGRGDNEAPACHQMHFGWQFCKQFIEEGNPASGTAQCQADIDGVEAWHAIRHAIASTLPQARDQTALEAPRIQVA